MSYSNSNNKSEVKDRSKLYPAQCIAFNRPTQTLAVYAYLSSAREGAEPALTMNSPFSRFEITAIDKAKSGEDVYVTSNILAGTELAYLRDKYYQTLYSANKKKEANLSPAYTVVFKSGFLKGKTVAEILSEDSSKKEELLRTRSWLSKPENLNKYPDNIKIIEAIDDGINKLNKNELDADIAKSNSTIIFEENYKQIRAYTVQSSICISYVPSNRFPWSFTIQNDKILEKKPDNTIVTEGKVKSITIYLSDKEMAALINTMTDLSIAFKVNTYPLMQARANAIMDSNRNNKS